MDIGCAEIVAGFANKDFPMKDGYIVTTLVEAGVDRKTALTISTAYDLLKTGKSAGDVISKTGTSLNELQLLLNAKNVTDDVKNIIIEEMKRQAEEKKKSEEKKKRETKD
ncbi:MAG: hypothetical protein A4E59_00107 [Syntrophorhabdus sp. PtaB.Bin027]|nr:MAG: hypothetical protein A4E59_00107 [Syntrophorhabdus sp. PtaB.Bin027]